MISLADPWTPYQYHCLGTHRFSHLQMVGSLLFQYGYQKIAQRRTSLPAGIFPRLDIELVRTVVYTFLTEFISRSYLRITHYTGSLFVV